MQEKEFNKITITEIINKAQVARASFYRNFKDKNDILQQESNRLFKLWGGKFKLDGSDQKNETFISLLDYLKTNSHFYLTLYQSNQDHILRKNILDQFTTPKDSNNLIAYLFTSIGYMTYGWIHEWIKRGMQESGTELAKLFEQVNKKSNSI